MVLTYLHRYYNKYETAPFFFISGGGGRETHIVPCEYGYLIVIHIAYCERVQSMEWSSYDGTYNQKCLYSVNTLLIAPTHCITEYHWSVS